MPEFLKYGTQPPWPEPRDTISRLICIGVRCSQWRALSARSSGKPSSHSITDVCLTAFHSIPSSDSASEAPLYRESDHKATDPKTSLRSAAQENTQTQSDPQTSLGSAAWDNTQTQSDPARFFLLIASAIQRATYVPVLQCLTAIVINS